jgi:lysozyme
MLSNHLKDKISRTSRKYQPFCGSSRDMKNFILSFKSLFVFSVCALGLAACSVGDQTQRYPKKGDVKPHAGVASAQGFAVHGIDISKWQGDIDWRAVKDAGTQFVFIKATEGGDHLDERFYQNWAGAKSVGIPRAAYHFVFWCRPAHEQAQWFRQHIPNDPDSLPPVLDVEWNGHSKLCPRKIPRELALEKIRLMLRELEQHTGKKPIIYTDITFHKDVLEAEFPEYSFWLRSVAAEPQERYHNRPWTFWQYTTTGRIPGIRGDVDRNVFAGSQSEWDAYVKELKRR